MACSYCRQKGHNIRRCSQKKAEEYSKLKEKSNSGDQWVYRFAAAEDTINATTRGLETTTDSLEKNQESLEVIGTLVNSVVISTAKDLKVSKEARISAGITGALGIVPGALVGVGTGAIAGVSAGAALGTMTFPIAGTAIGVIVGGAVGIASGIAGGVAIGAKLGKLFTRPKKNKASEQSEAQEEQFRRRLRESEKKKIDPSWRNSNAVSDFSDDTEYHIPIEGRGIRICICSYF